MSLVDYVVLCFNPETGAWREVHTGTYRTPQAAKKAGAEEHGTGSYVAIPARSWTPEAYIGRQMTVWEVAPVSVAEKTG